MSLRHLQESFQIGAFNSQYYYYDSGSTLTSPGNVGKFFANTDPLLFCLANVCSMLPVQHCLGRAGEGGGRGGNWSEFGFYHACCPNPFRPRCSIQGEQKYFQSLHATQPGISYSLMGHLANMQTLTSPTCQMGDVLLSTCTCTCMFLLDANKGHVTINCKVHGSTLTLLSPACNCVTWITWG